MLIWINYRSKKIKVLQLPYFEGITIDTTVEFAESYRGDIGATALPTVKKDVLKLPRAYIANVI